jgi:hypothetical protein
VFKGGLYPTQAIYALFYSYFIAKKQYKFEHADLKQGDFALFKIHFQPPKLKRFTRATGHSTSLQRLKRSLYAG